MASETVDELLRLLTSQGAEIDPSIEIVMIDGDYRVHSAGVTPLLVHLPRDLLVRESACEWGSRGDVMVAEVTGELTSVQQEVLHLMVAFYNAAGKLAWYRSMHPRGALAPEGRLVTAIRALRPSWQVDDTVSGFLRSRTISLARPPSTDPSPADASAWLMPVVELVNHHSEALPFGTPEQSVEVATWHAPGTSECRVRYRAHADAIDMAIGYGFVDGTASIAQVAPTSIPVTGLGHLTIESRFLRRDPNRSFPTVRVDESGVTLSHLLVDEHTPGQARAAVRLALLSAAQQRGLPSDAAERAVGEALESLVDVNRRLLADVVAAATEEGGPAAETVAAAAEQQERIIATLAAHIT